jgi:hypothetical protein
MATGRVTCSSSYASGWCDTVADGAHGTCNTGEWATSTRSTGWVELSWASPTTVNSVGIYDRACDEKVLAGQLEFSDGSANIAFGALEDTGATPTTITFSAKQLLWLRVVIDASEDGDNPGFGEISIE